MTAFLELARRLLFVQETKIIVVSTINATGEENSLDTKHFRESIVTTGDCCNLCSRNSVRDLPASGAGPSADFCKRRAHQRLWESDARSNVLARTLHHMLQRDSRPAGQAGIAL
jgi:hypothetical protein